MSSNRELVIKVMKAVFVDRDATVVPKHFAPDYKQHNPSIPNGRDAIPGLIASLAPNFRYEMGAVTAEGDYVMVHGRYTGWGPKPMVAVDIFRVAGGMLVEHWDVLQEEVPASATANGNAMF